MFQSTPSIASYSTGKVNSYPLLATASSNAPASLPPPPILFNSPTTLPSTLLMQQSESSPRPIATLSMIDKNSIYGNSREFKSSSAFNMSSASGFTASSSSSSSMGNTDNTSDTQFNQNNQFSDTTNRPKLHFCKKSQKDQTCAELHSDPEFRLNDKTKHPPNTLFNVSIKDVLTVTGYSLNDCEMFLRLDNGSQHGSPVGSCFFKSISGNLNDMTSPRVFRAKIDIPPSLNTKKGNTSSRVGFVEIHDSNNKMIAVSDKFWIRSRSRNQMVKDESTKKRMRMNQQGRSETKHQKQVFHQYSPSSPQEQSETEILNSPYHQPTNNNDEAEPFPKKLHSTTPSSGKPLPSQIGFSNDHSQAFSTMAINSFLPNAEPWQSGRVNTDNTLSPGPSFSFLDREFSSSATSSSRPSQTDTMKTLEGMVRDQQQKIEELSCLIANNAKLIHGLQMHVLLLTNPINSEP